MSVWTLLRPPRPTQLSVVENADGEKAVFGAQNDKYWFWNLADPGLVGKTFAEQAALVELLQTIAYFGLTNWRMATIDDMVDIAPTAHDDQAKMEVIAENFNPSEQLADGANYVARYDLQGSLASATPGTKPIGTGIFAIATVPDDTHCYPLSGPLVGINEIGTALSPWTPLSAWIVADASSVIPEPGTVLLLAIGLIGLLALRRKATKHQ